MGLIDNNSTLDQVVVWYHPILIQICDAIWHHQGPIQYKDAILPV